MELPEYKKLILDTLDEYARVCEPYAGEDSPLEAEKAKALTQRLAKTKDFCKSMDNFKPRIMLYGVYNSGKSTLLNALMGEEKAEVGDIPKTARSEVYDWRGFELVDTPGIDAPIEHEIITKETLRKSQVVVFVISSRGSFENGAIYEAMKDVAASGKKLVIVLNNKDDEYGEDELASIKERIQKNLEETGLSRREAASFRLGVTNAQDGLEGRQNNDEKLIQYSGIEEIEELIFRELKNASGFDVAKDVLAYLSTEYNFLLDRLSEACSNDSDRQNAAFLELRSQYHDFRSSMEAMVEEECGTMSAEIFRSFPPPGGQYSEQVVRETINGVIESYNAAIAGKLQAATERFKDALLRQGAKIIETAENGLSLRREVTNLEELFDVLSGTQDARELEEPLYAEEVNIVDKIGDAAAMLATLPILKLPVPLPLPPVIVSLCLMGVKVIASLFGKSDSERQNERARARMEYERELREQQARREARLREEMIGVSENIRNRFVRDTKTYVRRSLSERFDPVLAKLREQCDISSREFNKIRADIGRLQDGAHKIQVIRDELSA